MLDPWIIEEIIEREEQKRIEKNKQQPRIEAPLDIYEDPTKTSDYNSGSVITWDMA